MKKPCLLNKTPYVMSLFSPPITDHYRRPLPRTPVFARPECKYERPF